MANYTGVVFLGGLDFKDYEIPQEIKGDGPMRTVVHKQPGGARQIDVMGNDPDPFEWSGLFLSNDAIDRADLVREMKIAGKPVILSYGSKSYTVIISDFTTQYRAPMMIEYRIKCIPVVDGDNGAAAAPAPNLNNVPAANIAPAANNIAPAGGLT